MIKWNSRKLLVLAIATIALYTKYIDGWMWLTAAGIYIGSNVLENIKGIKNGG